MSSKTFENTHTVHGKMTVREDGGCVSVSVNMDSSSDTIIHISPSDAPALALAILEAAGVEPSSPHYGLNDSPEWNVRWASHYLGRSIELTEAKAAEAKEQAELEAEALDLFNTLQTEIHGNLGPNWVPVTGFPGDETKRKWLAVARKAREMRAEK